jgi:GT2 family glycosyltransferase
MGALGQSPPESPLFSVIVLNWNGKHLLEECLETLHSQTFRDFEIVVVDNGSTDGSVGWVKERCAGQVRVVELPENRGFAEGNNAGIRASQGIYVILLNNDTAVDPGWLAAIAGAIGRHPEAGMFTPKILNFYRRDEIDNTGHVIYLDGLARGRHRLEKDDGRFDEEGEAIWPSGCAGVYRKEMLDEIGLLDETFFAYGEDVDLGLRARWAGWECYYVPKAVVYHKYSATAGVYSSRKAFLVERNRLWILVKNFPLREVLFSPLRTAYRYGIHLYGALSGRGASGKFAGQFSVWRLFLTTLKAEAAAIAGIPRVLRERKDMRRLRRISPAAFRGLLRRFAMDAPEAALKE